MERAHDADERRNNGKHTPPTTHSAALPTYPSPQAPRPCCTARALAVRDARRVRARVGAILLYWLTPRRGSEPQHENSAATAGWGLVMVP